MNQSYGRLAKASTFKTHQGFDYVRGIHLKERNSKHQIKVELLDIRTTEVVTDNVERVDVVADEE